jgi:hypothetical protein
MAERKGSALLRRRAGSASQVRVLLLPLFRRGRAVRRATVNRETQVRPLPPEPESPWSKGYDTGPSTRRCGFESRRGIPSGCRGGWPPRRFREPEIAGSTPASQTSRGRGAAVLASFMSSRPQVRILPAQLGGVAQSGAERSLVRREGAGSNPVVSVHGGCGVTAAPGVVIPAASVRIRSATPSRRTLSTGELPRL